MHVAVLTFDGYNELDSLIAFGILNRVTQPGWRVSIACPTSHVTSMNGVVIESQVTLQEACAADAVIVGSGLLTRQVVANAALMAELRLDPSRQLLGAQCSGPLVLRDPQGTVLGKCISMNESRLELHLRAGDGRWAPRSR